MKYVKVGYYDDGVVFAEVEADDAMYAEYLKGMADDLESAKQLVEEFGDNQSTPHIDYYSDDLWLANNHSIPPLKCKEEALFLFMKDAWHICTNGVDWDLA